MHKVYFNRVSDNDFVTNVNSIITKLLGVFSFSVPDLFITNLNPDGSYLPADMAQIGGVNYAATHGYDYRSQDVKFLSYGYVLLISNERLNNGTTVQTFGTDGHISAARIIFHELMHTEFTWESRTPSSINFEEELAVFAENVIYSRAASSIGESDGGVIRYAHQTTAAFPGRGVSGVNSFAAYTNVSLGVRSADMASFVASEGGRTLTKTYYNFDHQVDNVLYDHYITLVETAATPYVSVGPAGFSVDGRVAILVSDMMGSTNAPAGISSAITAISTALASTGSSDIRIVSRVLGLGNDAYSDGDANEDPFFYVGAVAAGSTSNAPGTFTTPGGALGAPTMFNINDMMSNTSTLIIGPGHGAAFDNIKAGSGDDIIIGTGSGAAIQGGVGKDVIVGTAGGDQLFGGDQADIIVGSGGSDQIDGGDGFDILTYATSSASVSFNATTGHGTGGMADGDVTTSIERLIGSNYADHFIGAANMSIDGRDGADRYEAGNQVVDVDDTGFDGAIDELSFAQRTQGVVLDVVSQSTAAGDSFKGVERLVGTSSVDIFKVSGTPHANLTIVGGGGDDIVRFTGSQAISMSGLVGTGGAAVGLTFQGVSAVEGSSAGDTFSGAGVRYYGMGGNDVFLGGAGGWFDGGDHFDEFREMASGLSHTFSLVDDQIWLSLGQNVSKLSSVERISFLNASSAIGFTFLTADAIAVLSAYGASMSGQDLRSALISAGSDIDGAVTGRTYTSNATDPVPGGTGGIIDGTSIGGGVTYSTSNPLAVTLKDFPEPGHIGEVAGSGFTDQLYNLDFVEGGDGVDTFNVWGSSPFSASLAVNGKGGEDTLSFSSLAVGSNLVVNIASGVATTSAGSVSFSQFEKYVGSIGNDRFRFAGGGIVADAGGGVDIADFSEMGGGTITDASLTGFETFVGSTAADVFKVSKPGSQTFIGGGGLDAVSYEGQSSISVSGNAGIGGAAAGDLYSGITYILGSASTDNLRGNLVYYGMGGADNFYVGGSGIFAGGSGSDKLINETSVGYTYNLNNGTASGSTGNNQFIGIDEFVGGSGNDVFNGGRNLKGDNQTGIVRGGGGNDTIYADSGLSAYGDANDDRIIVMSTGVGVVDGGSGFDTLVVSSLGQTILDLAAKTLTVFGVVKDVSSFEDFVLGSGSKIFGTNAAETIAGVFSGSVDGRGGNDTIDIYGNSGRADGGLGNDTIRMNGSNGTAYGGADNDTITSYGWNILYGDDGDDTLRGGPGSSNLYGGAGNDTIYFGQTSAGTWGAALPGTGNNTIYGGPGDDQVGYYFTHQQDGDSGYLKSITYLGGNSFLVETSESTDYLHNVEFVGFAGIGWNLTPGFNWQMPQSSSSMRAADESDSTMSASMSSEEGYSESDAQWSNLDPVAAPTPMAAPEDVIVSDVDHVVDSIFPVDYGYDGFDPSLAFLPIDQTSPWAVDSSHGHVMQLSSSFEFIL